MRERGGYVLGVCNGFQVLTETGLLPGALMRNAGLKFVCRPVELRSRHHRQRLYPGLPRRRSASPSRSPITTATTPSMRATLARLRAEDRIAFTYVDNPNGSVADIAGVLSDNRRVLGMMPHPERAVDPAHGGTDGVAMFAAR